MNQVLALVALLFVLLAVGTGWYVFAANAPAPAPPGAGPSGPATEPQDTPVHELTADDSPPSTKAAQPTRPTTPEVKPAAKPQNQLAQRLGWTDTAPAEQAAAWHQHVVTLQTQFTEAFSDGDARAAAQEFNETMDAQRRKLIEEIGASRAGQVLQELPLYRFDLDTGTWHRVGADGQVIPFKDPRKEDVWVRFERR